MLHLDDFLDLVNETFTVGMRRHTRNAVGVFAAKHCLGTPFSFLVNVVLLQHINDTLFCSKKDNTTRRGEKG